MENTIGKKIATLRKELGLRQEDLAEKLNVTPQAVSKWENDLTCPDISILPELSDILGVSIDELIKGKPKDAEIVTIVPEEERKEVNKMTLRLVIVSCNGDKVKINIPLSIVTYAIENGIDLPQISDNKFKNIDLNKIIELVNRGVVGNLMEIESADGDTIQIYVE